MYNIDFHQVGDARLNGGAIPEGALAGPEDPSVSYPGVLSGHQGSVIAPQATTVE